MTAPIPNDALHGPQNQAEHRRLVRLDCDACGKALGVCLVEDCNTFALCPSCAPAAALRRHPATEDAEDAEGAEFEAAINAAEEAADKETEARYPNGASEVEIDSEFDRAFGQAFYRELRQRGLRTD